MSEMQKSVSEFYAVARADIRVQKVWMARTIGYNKKKETLILSPVTLFQNQFGV